MAYKSVILELATMFDKKKTVFFEVSDKNPLYSKLSFKRTLLVSPFLSPFSVCNVYLNKYLGKRITYFRLDPDSFFEREVKTRGVFELKEVSIAYIHNSKNFATLYRTISNTLDSLPKGSYVLVPNCNPISAQQAYPATSENHLKMLVEEEKLLDSYPKDWLGDTWKCVVRLRSERSDCEVFVLDVDFGLCVIKKVRSELIQKEPIFSLQELNLMTYEHLEKNRKKFLNLKDPFFLEDYIKS